MEARGNWLDTMLAVVESPAGVSVTPESALTSSAVYACVRILAETIASLPLLIYERLERGKRRADDFYLYDVLHNRPNPIMTAFEFREVLQCHLAQWGNAYCEIEYAGSGQITALWPLRPDQMESITRQGDSLIYKYRLPDGTEKLFDQSRLWHLRGMGSDGIYGYSPISMMRNAVGLGMAAEKYGSKFFGNGARPSGVLEHPGVLGTDAAATLRQSWNEMHLGLDNAQRVAILEEGMKYQQIGIPPEDAQFLQTRRFQLGEVARIYRVPLHMIGDLEKATFSNIEHQSIEFVVHTIRPWTVRWEQSIWLNLLTEGERERYFAEYLLDGLLRGDTPSRYSAYATGFQNGWLSQNDIRGLENMNPVEGGDRYYVPMNLAPVGAVAPVGDLTPNPSPKGEGGEEEEGRALTPGHLTPGPSPEGEGGVESRAMARGVRSRRRAFEAIYPVFEDGARRVLRRERNDVGSQARKALTTSPSPEGGGVEPAQIAEFERWLEGFYDEHASFARKQLAPAMTSYARAVVDAVEDELEELRVEAVKAGLAEPGEATYDQVQGFVESYMAQYGVRHASRSLAWLLDALHGAEPGKELEAIEGKLEDWMEWRPEDSANEEATRESNAVSKAAYRTAGILRIRSMAFGESCPFCRGLDGKVIDIEKFFLEAGVPFMPEGAAGPLVVSSSKSHAPYHGGCDCMTFASL